MKMGGRLIAIGDIHGCLAVLLELIQKIKPGDDDKFIFLGDYIDRGNDSVGTVDYLMGFRLQHETVCLRGNHEQMLLDWIDQKDNLWLQFNNGGDKTQQQYAASQYGGIPEGHLRFFRGLQPYWQYANFIFVHAGLRPYVPLKEQKDNEMLWMREPFLSSKYDWGKTIVYGHTMREEPLVTETRIALDTGAACGGNLTGCDVLSGRTWKASQAN